jgi:hypothetical protein
MPVRTIVVSIQKNITEHIEDGGTPVVLDLVHVPNAERAVLEAAGAEMTRRKTR